MKIEEQRWAPLSASCAPASGGFGWSEPLGDWDDVMEDVDHRLLFHVELMDGKVAGSYLTKGCTEFASYKDAWMLWSGTVDDIGFALEHAFDGKGARLLDIRLKAGSSKPPYIYNVILVPNFGPAARNWWWGHGAPMDKLADVLQGKAWKSFKADNIKKKLTSLTRQPKAKYAFVATETAPGDAWWWGSGATVDDLVKVTNGEHWKSFPEDKIKKRLVSLQARRRWEWKTVEVHGTREIPVWEPDIYGKIVEKKKVVPYTYTTKVKGKELPPHFTFIAVPWAAGVRWWWLPAASFGEIKELANANDARIVDIRRYASSKTKFSAIFVGNS
jgi:hypothetical protein